MSAVRKRLARTMTRTIAAHDLVRPGDHVMVAVSEASRLMRSPVRSLSKKATSCSRIAR